MGCANCSSSGGVPRGCKNNGTCSSGGCNKLGVFDWLSNMTLPSGQSEFDIVEVRFKNGRKSFYKNIKGLPLQAGDVVVTEVSPGYDVGVISMIGELVKIQIRKKASNFKPHEARKVLRKATEEDVKTWVEAREMEHEVMHEARKLANSLHLEMKISDVEYQGDKTKATFYYTAEDRIDFRQLIKDMADKFKLRIEMRQIGARQEAARLGGIGSCGRELCCSTWLTDFRSVSTSAARYQQLSLNPQKLAGQCGKLKCCLNYELDMYLDVLKEFPSADTRLKTAKGMAHHVKTDVFKRVMWFAYDRTDEPGTNGLFQLSPDRVKEILVANKKGETPVELVGFVEEKAKEAPEYSNVDAQDSLNRFDENLKKKKKKKKKPKQAGQNPNQANQNNPNQNKIVANKEGESPKGKTPPPTKKPKKKLVLEKKPNPKNNPPQ